MTGPKKTTHIEKYKNAPKIKRIKVDDVKKIPRTAIPLTPKNVRKQIFRLENVKRRIQMAIHKTGNALRRNQMIELLQQTQDKERQMYFLLHELKEKGDVQKEIDRKLQEDWDKRKCPKCEHAKLNDEGHCPNSECELWVEIKEAEENEHEQAMMETEIKIKEEEVN